MTQKSIDEAEMMAASGSLEDAVRFSGEELARLDNIWRRAHNAHLHDANTPAGPADAVARTAVTEMATMAVCHADMLMRAGMPQDAFAVTLTTIAALTMEGADRTEPQLMMTLCALTCLALNTLAETDPMPPALATPEAREHFPVIISYCASMLYHWYAQTVAAPTPWHQRITPLLRTLIRAGAVQSPTLTIATDTRHFATNTTEGIDSAKGSEPAQGPTTTVDSAGNTAAILPDLLGRALALGLLQ